MHYAGLPADSNFRIALGDLLDRNGRRVEARKWYEEARQIYERQVRTGILESNEDLVEQYYMRLGKPKVVAKSLKSLAPNVVQPGNRGIGTSRQISGAQSMIPAQISNRAEDTLTDRNSDPLNSVSKKPVSDDQALFVETPAPPQLSERRKKALADMARQRLERDRKFFGTKNGMLAIDLENQFFGPFWGHEITTDAEAALAEWQTVYAKIPSACQRYLAPGALGVANQILLVVSQSGAFMSDMDAAKVREAEHKKWQPIADKITSSVLNAASANNWLLSPQMKSELQSTISKNDNPNFRKQAQEILERKPPQVDVEYDRLLSDTMTLVAAQMDRAPTKNVKLQKQENSWLPNYFASLNDPDGKLKKEILASTPTEIPIKVIPLEHVTEVNLKIRSLEDCFARLPDSSKERVTADTLKFVESAFASHAQVAVESLLWRVVNAIDPEWLEYNAIALPNVYYFGDVDKAKKLCLKKIEILDMHSFGGIPENSQARYELGDVLDRNGRRVEARRWYEEARKIDERQRVRMDSQENTEFMDHEYNMRIGNLKPATSTSN
jgi:tetratricopeptide (TPR) repeat protein